MASIQIRFIRENDPRYVHIVQGFRLKTGCTSVMLLTEDRPGVYRAICSGGRAGHPTGYDYITVQEISS